jgi:hypothetical protein
MAMSKKKSKRRFAAFGSLDKKTRGWQYLPKVRSYVGYPPAGDDLVFSMNDTTLEVGQGVSGLRGFVWLVGMFGFGACLFGLYQFLYFDIFSSASNIMSFVEDMGVFLSAIIFFGVLLIIPCAFLMLSIFLGDLFGYVDIPLRFDRINRKVYMWSPRKEGPLILDWDRLKVVAQSVGAPPYQVNQFRSVLLVDEDADGEVRFEGKQPRIAQIGAALLNREATLGAYEYVRVFMERGPQALPRVNRHLTWRPKGIREFVDVFGLCGTMMRDFPSKPSHQRSWGWLIFGVAIIAVFSPILVLLQCCRGVALKFTTRIPKWSAEYESLAAQGGSMVPPIGSQPVDRPVLLHEKIILSIWGGAALCAYGWAIISIATRN